MLRFKKIICILFALLIFLSISSISIFATNYEISTSPPSSTYVEYLKQVDFSLNEKYILFRSASENGSTHILAVGKDLSFDRNTGLVSGEAVVYIYNNPSYGSGSSSFYFVDDENFSVTYENEIIYSNFIEGIPSFQSIRDSNLRLIIISVLLIIFVVLFICVFYKIIRG